MAAYVDRIQRNDPKTAIALQQAFRGHDYARVYDNLVRGDGLAGNDLANSMTAYAVLTWLIANNRLEEPSGAAVRAARAQTAAALANDPRFASPAARAQLGEEFKLLFVTIHSGAQSARREGMMQAYSNRVAQMIRAQSGRDPRSRTLTDRGFS